MSVKLDVRQPGVKVVLRKNIGRTTTHGSTPVSDRYKQLGSDIDLTDWLADGLPVRVMKSVTNPVGAFEVTLADRIDSTPPDFMGAAAYDQTAVDTIYAAIEPMDGIEIYMAGNAYKYAGRGLPIMMRGFVTTVERVESMGPDGRPHRVITIRGHDYGKILMRLQLFGFPGMPQWVESAMTSFPFFTRTGAAPNAMDASKFVGICVEKLVNPYLKRIQSVGGNQGGAYAMGYDASVANSTIIPYGISPASSEGKTLWGLLSENCDVGTFNELFVEDREDGPYLVYRPNPYLDALSKTVLMSDTAVDGWAPPSPNDIDSSDVVSITATRSDIGVANYFFIDNPRGNMASVFGQQAPDGKAVQGIVDSYGNVSPDLYGLSRMRASTNQTGPTESNGIGLQGEAQQKWQKVNLDWVAVRRQQLVYQNVDNVIFEQGSMSLKGNESIRAGTYISLARGPLVSLYYAHSVVHEFVPFGNYFTSVEFARGTGFINRIQSGLARPFDAEKPPSSVAGAMLNGGTFPSARVQVGGPMDTISLKPQVLS